MWLASRISAMEASALSRIAWIRCFRSSSVMTAAYRRPDDESTRAITATRRSVIGGRSCQQIGDRRNEARGGKRLREKRDLRVRNRRGGGVFAVAPQEKHAGVRPGRGEERRP